MLGINSFPLKGDHFTSFHHCIILSYFEGESFRCGPFFFFFCLDRLSDGLGKLVVVGDLGIIYMLFYFQ